MQARDGFSGYVRGALVCGKRFGADYADTVTGTFIEAAISETELRSSRP
jgi:hypothetical protein